MMMQNQLKAAPREKHGRNSDKIESITLNMMMNLSFPSSCNLCGNPGAGVRRRFNADHWKNLRLSSDKEVITSSDFKRAFQSEYGKAVGVTLWTQYRMAPAIGNLVSACFYGKLLKNGRGDPPEWYNLLPEYLRAQVTWVDTSCGGSKAFDERSTNNSEGTSHSFCNRYEANIVLKLLEHISQSSQFMNSLVENCKEGEVPIGVICTYAEQKRLVQKRFNEADWAGELRKRRLVKIDTVDSYQGKENRIIILSLTRNNQHYRQGYISSLERINVSLSRAMDRLYIIGATRMWSEHNQESPVGKVWLFLNNYLAEEGGAYAFVSATTLLKGGL